MVSQCLALGILRVSSGRINLLSAIEYHPIQSRIGCFFSQKKGYLKLTNLVTTAFIIGDIGPNLKIILPYKRPNDKNRVILAIKWTLKQGRENLTIRYESAFQDCFYLLRRPA